MPAAPDRGRRVGVHSHRHGSHAFPCAHLSHAHYPQAAGSDKRKRSEDVERSGLKPTSALEFLSACYDSPLGRTMEWLATAPSAATRRHHSRLASRASPCSPHTHAHAPRPRGSLPHSQCHSHTTPETLLTTAREGRGHGLTLTPDQWRCVVLKVWLHTALQLRSLCAQCAPRVPYTRPKN